MLLELVFVLLFAASRGTPKIISAAAPACASRIRDLIHQI